MPGEEIVQENVQPEPQASPAPNADFALALRGLTGVDWVGKAAELVLTELNVTKDDPLSGKAIYQKVREQVVVPPVAESTFSIYLGDAVKRAEFPFTSTGKGRGGGYYISATTRELAQEATTQKDTQAQGDSRRKNGYTHHC